MLKSCEAGLSHLYMSTHDYYLFVCLLILFVFSLLWFLSLLGPDDWWNYSVHRWLKGSDILYVSLILPFCETVDWVTPKYTRLWLHDLFHCQCINLTQLLVWGKCIWVFLEAVRWAYREADEGMRKCSRSGGNEYFLRSWIGVVLSRGFGPKKKTRVNYIPLTFPLFNDHYDYWISAMAPIPFLHWVVRWYYY